MPIHKINETWVTNKKDLQIDGSNIKKKKTTRKKNDKIGKKRKKKARTKEKTGITKQERKN